jgi:hypothetical protein
MSKGNIPKKPNNGLNEKYTNPYQQKTNQHQNQV